MSSAHIPFRWETLEVYKFGCLSDIQTCGIIRYLDTSYHIVYHGYRTVWLRVLRGLHVVCCLPKISSYSVHEAKMQDGRMITGSKDEEDTMWQDALTVVIDLIGMGKLTHKFNRRMNLARFLDNSLTCQTCRHRSQSCCQSRGVFRWLRMPSRITHDQSQIWTCPYSC